MNLKEYFKQRFISILSEQENLKKPSQVKELPDEVRNPSNGFSSHYHGGRTRAQARTSSANQRARR